MYEIFTVGTHGNNTANYERVDHHTRVPPKNFDFKTGTPKLDETVNEMSKNLWQNIISLVDINRDYYRCLMDIMDTKNEKHFKDLKNDVVLALKRGEKAESFESELLTVCQTNLRKIAYVLDSENKSYGETMAYDPFLNYRSKLDDLQSELAENKKNLKISGSKIALLEREKRDLLNILNSYDSENVHKVSLEKRLKVEQMNNDKLRDMINLVFKKKMPYFYNDNVSLL